MWGLSSFWGSLVSFSSSCGTEHPGGNLEDSTSIEKSAFCSGKSVCDSSVLWLVAAAINWSQFLDLLRCQFIGWNSKEPTTACSIKAPEIMYYSEFHVIIYSCKTITVILNINENNENFEEILKILPVMSVAHWKG